MNHLEDLRSILKKVVTDDTSRKEEPPKERVAEVLKNEPKTEPVRVEKAPPHTEQPQLPREPLTQVPDPRAQKTGDKINASEPNANAVTPKELERMMRITTSDKPPF
jgi:hypothetical protein